jgi:selenocysteine lyase/cysteine desulfurase
LQEPPPIYLNHAGTSWPKPAVVVNAVQEAMAASPETWPKSFVAAHEAVCRFFGIQQVDQLLLTPGCTSALAVALANVDLPHGSRVLTSCWEHHAMAGPLRAREDRGVTVTELPPDGDRPIDLNRLESELRKGDVGLIAVTAACNVTGDLLPVDDIVRLAHRYRVRTLIDAAQIVGWIDIDFDSLGADIIAFGGHKGLQSPWGIGGLYINDDITMQCVTASCELPQAGAAKSLVFDPEAETSKPPGNARPGYCDVGSVDQFALAGLHAAVDYLSQSTRADDLATARKQAARLRKALASCSNVRLFGCEHPEARLPTIAFAVRECSSDMVAARLKQNGIISASGYQCSPHSHQTLGTAENGVVRLSVGVRQSDADIERAVDRLSGVLSEFSSSRSAE